MTKSDFGAFAKAFTNNTLHDSEISEFMSYYAKQRALATAKKMRGTPTNDTMNSNEEMFQLTNSSIVDPRVDINILDGLFDKWYKDQEAVSGVLNIKVTRQKNIDFRKTIEAWKKREKERARHKKRHFERGKQLRAAFEKY